MDSILLQYHLIYLYSREKNRLPQHLKATMMKVSDPILFGHCVRVFFKDVFEKHGQTLEEIGANPNLGLGAVLDAIDKKLPSDKAQEIRNDIDACYEERPWLAMVNSDKGITNLVGSSLQILFVLGFQTCCRSETDVHRLFIFLVRISARSIRYYH